MSLNSPIYAVYIYIYIYRYIYIWVYKLAFSHIAPFWNPQDQTSTMGVFLGIIINHQGDQKGQKQPKLTF